MSAQIVNSPCHLGLPVLNGSSMLFLDHGIWLSTMIGMGFVNILKYQGWATSGLNLNSGFFGVENVVFSSAIVALCLYYRFFFLSLCSSLKYVYWGFTFFSVASVTSDWPYFCKLRRWMKTCSCTSQKSYLLFPTNRKYKTCFTNKKKLKIVAEPCSVDYDCKNDNYIYTQSTSWWRFE